MDASVRANLVKVRVLTDASATTLQTAVNAFLAALQSETLLSVQFQYNGTAFSVLISYTR